MVKDTGYGIKKMSVDGGMTVNNFLLQSQANFTNVNIVRKTETEVTGLGAAIAAGLKVGFWKSLEDVEANIKVDRQFTSEITEKERNKKL